MSVNWFEVSRQPRSKLPGCRADNESHLKLPVKVIGCPLTSNRLTLTLPWVKARTGSGPDPFPPPRNKRERVGYARLNLILTWQKKPHPGGISSGISIGRTEPSLL